jgi:hypothetical protein
MANVIRLFSSKDSISKAASQDAAIETQIRMAIADMVGPIGSLAPRIRELEAHLDNLDWVISHLQDSKVRQALRDLAKVHRESLAEATRKLASEVRKLQYPIPADRQSGVL